MKTKALLFTVALVVLVAVVWFYQKRRNATSPVSTEQVPVVEVAKPATQPTVIKNSTAIATRDSNKGSVSLLPPAAAIALPQPNSIVPTDPAAASKPPATAGQSTTEATLATQPCNAATEVAATRRMFAAHASLRTAAVANPDSAQNRLILQTMVLKALSRASEVQPAASK